MSSNAHRDLEVLREHHIAPTAHLWAGRGLRKPLGKAGFGCLTHHHLRCLVPCRAGLQSGFDLSDQGIVDNDARFEVQRLDLKNTFLAVGLGIDATDQRVVLQDRQGEVAIFAFGRGRIDLDLVVEVEQVQGPRTVPHQWVERR